MLNQTLSKIGAAADAADGEEPANVSDSANESPEDKSPSPRPQRRRQPPYWLRSGEYITISAANPLKERLSAVCRLLLQPLQPFRNRRVSNYM